MRKNCLLRYLTALFALVFSLVVTALIVRAATLRDVVISEVAWMGTTTASEDEWMELYNNTDTDVDLTDWRLVTSDGGPNILLEGIIPASGYYLLERTGDTSVVSYTADLIYTGSLSNDPGEVITLTDAFSNVVDVVGLPDEAWFAGDNTTKETMTRFPLTATGTISTSWINGPVKGTPTNSIVDLDSDTYGYSPNFDWTAGDGSGYEQRDEDCDDGDPQTHPGATEVPDYEDNDCNGQIDDGLDLGPLAWTVHFDSDTTINASHQTTETVPMESALISYIDAATDTIDVAVYGLDRSSLANALIDAHNRGVTVRVVGDDVQASGYYSPTYTSLISAGIPVVTDPYVSYLQHNKFAIFDRCIVWTGSTNWTNTGFTYNANNCMALTAPHLALAYTTEFEEMFVEGQFAHQKTDNTTHVFSYTNVLVESYFSPSDGVEAQVAEVISNAQESLHFAMFYWTSDALGPLVYARVVTDGLTVSGVWDATGAANAFSEDELLCSAGVPLKVENFGGKVHHKFAVADVSGDDPVVILGSYNWTEAGAFDNDENTLIIHDANLAQAYYQEYLKLYNAIPDDAICSDHSAESGMPACMDCSDNDYDGYVDDADWDCRESTLETCQDSIDNDGDGDIDTDDLDCYRCRLFAVGISGNDSVELGQPLTLTTWLSPAAAPGPLTYTWGENPSTGATATYVWDELGVYNVQVTVTNWCKAVSDTHVVTATGEITESVVYLPFVVRNYSPRADLHITTLEYDSSDEYIEITNLGTAAQDMTGWRIHSVVGDQWYTFPAGYTLDAGASVRVHSGPDAYSDPPTHLLWGSAYIWNNNGDKAVLYNAADQQVDDYCYQTGCP